jgi:hypothetical protein
VRHRFRRRHRCRTDAAPLNAQPSLQASEEPETRPPVAESSDAESAASLTTLAHEGIEYLRNFLQLLLGETALAGSSLRRLFISALVVPAIVLSTWLTLNALLVALLEKWLHGWIIPIVIVLVFDVVTLALFLLSMRRWWADLSLPRSRAAIARLMDRPK